ncbi:MAG: hypothetical protein RRX93_07785 [Bacteroidales bacterium]
MDKVSKIPTTLPANGGNTDIVAGKHYSDWFNMEETHVSRNVNTFYPVLITPRE